MKFVGEHEFKECKTHAFADEVIKLMRRENMHHNQMHHVVEPLKELIDMLINMKTSSTVCGDVISMCYKFCSVSVLGRKLFKEDFVSNAFILSKNKTKKACSSCF